MGRRVLIKVAPGRWTDLEDAKRRLERLGAGDVRPPQPELPDVWIAVVADTAADDRTLAEIRALDGVDDVAWDVWYYGS